MGFNEILFLEVWAQWGIPGNNELSGQKEGWEYFDNEGEGLLLFVQWVCDLQRAEDIDFCYLHFFHCFLHLLGGSCIFLQKRIISGYASKPAVCVLGNGCLGWLMCAWEPAAAGLCLHHLIAETLPEYQIPIPDTAGVWGRRQMVINRGWMINRQKKTHDGEMY